MERKERKKYVDFMTFTCFYFINVTSNVFRELQKLMLEDLYERKHCNSLLVPKADEDVRWVQEKQPNRRRRTTTVDSGLTYVLKETT